MLAVLAAALLPVHGAGPASDVSRSDNRFEEDWRVLAVDPASYGYASVTIAGSPLPMIVVSAHGDDGDVSGSAALPNGRLPHTGPSVTVANVPDNAPPQPSSLSLVRGRYVLDLTYPVRGHLEITPGRAGVTVGPWRLGPETVYGAGGATTVHASMSWSVPVAAGTVSGWLEANGHSVELNGWRAYHDHIWGQFRRGATSWTHWDFAWRTPRPGESWILNGLQPTNGGFDPQPNDARWQGVLVHVTARGTRTCQATVSRGGWRNGWTQNTPWSAPALVAARCTGTSITFRAPDPARWPYGGFLRGIGGSAPLADGSGFIEHGQPLMPNS
jgi:hypothetical protein